MIVGVRKIAACSLELTPDVTNDVSKAPARVNEDQNSSDSDNEFPYSGCFVAKRRKDSRSQEADE